MKIIIIAVLSLCFTNSISARWDPENCLKVKQMGNVVASPDGKSVAFIVKEVIPTSSGKQWESRIFIRAPNGDEKSLSAEGSEVNLVRWFQSDKVIYLEQGEKYQSIWIQNIDNAEKVKLVEVESHISSFKVSPDFSRIAFVAENQDSLKNHRLYLISSDQKSSAIQTLTPNIYSITQIIGPYIDGGFDWAPDGKHIVFAYQPTAGANDMPKAKLAIVDLDTGQITEKYSGNQPCYSPDGKWIAFRSNLPVSAHASALNNNISYNCQLCVTNVQSLETKCLANTFNENPFIIGWDGLSSQLFVMDAYKTEGPQLYAVSLDPSKEPQRISTREDIFINPLTITLNEGRSIFGFAYETTAKPFEAFISSASSYEPVQISHVQNLPATVLGNTQVIQWSSFDGTVIEGLFTTPADYTPEMKYPLLVVIHGGPVDAWGKSYLGGAGNVDESIIPLCLGDLLSQGFTILQPNPRGSCGYGKKFQQLLYGDFAEGAYRDVMAGVDFLIEKRLVDPDRLAVCGWSYGGYLSAWAITQTNRFKAAIDGAGLTNLISFSGTTDISSYLPDWIGMPFWKQAGMYLKRSPIMYTKAIETPLLIIHGEKDERVPVTQAYELNTALKAQNKPVKMLILPGQSHVPTKPEVILECLYQVDEWLYKNTLNIN